MSEMRWYTLQVYSNYEKKVKEHIYERIFLNEMQDSFGEILVPVEEIIELRQGKKRKTERKLFPGYIFIQMIMSKTTWRLISDIPRVSGFLGGKEGKATPLSKRELKGIMLATNPEEGSIPKTRALYEIGSSVRILDGPFKDFSGTIQSVNYDKLKLEVAVSIFGRPTPVELEFQQVEKEV